MYVLINRDQMDLVAKHPNFQTLYCLGIINCPDAQEVIPFEQSMFKDYVDSELTMLYIGITLETPDDAWTRDQLEYLLMHLINEVPETLLDDKHVADQADYAIKWGLEGYCSFVKGKREPSMDEGLWDNCTLDFEASNAAILLATMSPIAFKAPIQRPFEKQRERSGAE